MTETSQLSTAIDELTNVTGKHAGEPVWIYGEMVWAAPISFDFIAIRGKLFTQVRLMTDQVRRYRDGETNLFLIEISSITASVLGLEDYLLGPGEIETKKKSCLKGCE